MPNKGPVNKEVKSKGLLVSAHGAEWGGRDGNRGPSLSLELQLHSLPLCVSAGIKMQTMTEP